MKVKRVIADELPKCCGGLPDKGNVNYHPEPCSGLVFGWVTWCMYTGIDIYDTDIRPSWCPLEVETVVQTDVEMVEQDRTQKPSAEVWQDMIELLEKINRKIASLPNHHLESHDR